MTDLAKLEAETLHQIDAADSEAALEAVRVGALGKKGAISALLATLGQNVARRAQDRRRARSMR